MNTTIKLAWRNLWRNKRRTIITVTSVFLAVILALFMRSMQIGSYEMMIQGGVSQVGYLQIQDTGYWNNKSIDHAFVYSDQLHQMVTKHPEIDLSIPHLESAALASSGKRSKVVICIGTPPSLENKANTLKNKLIHGNYLSEKDEGLLVAEKLAEYLQLITYDTVIQGGDTAINLRMLNDTLVLLGQGYQGVSAFGKYPVRGILHFGMPEMNNSFIYTSLYNQQLTFSPYVPDLVTQVLLWTSDPDKMQALKSELQSDLKSDMTVMDWKEMLKTMMQEIQSDNISGIIMLAILYIIIAFGIFGTIMMMTVERKREFGVMVAVGMRRGRLMRMLGTESLIIGMLGVVIGIVLSIPLLYYLNLNPIPLTGSMAEMMIEYNMKPVLPFSLKPQIFLNQGLAIFIITVISGIYPLVFALRFKLLNALER